MRNATRRPLLALAAVPLAAVLLTACQEQAAAPEPVTLDTPEKRLSYGVALRMGSRMKDDGMSLDVDAYALGMKDAFEGAEPRLTDEEINAEMVAFQQKLETERTAEMERMASDNLASGEAFLTENAAREGVMVTDSGLQYEVIEAGDGDMPELDDTVEVHYRGTLIDGTEFDSSYARGATVTFGVTQVIAGWTEALQLMKEGSKYKLFIPADLAYGAGGAGQVIQPNSTLIFDVELVSIVDDEAADEAEEAEATEEG